VEDFIQYWLLSGERIGVLAYVLEHQWANLTLGLCWLFAADETISRNC